MPVFFMPWLFQALEYRILVGQYDGHCKKIILSPNIFQTACMLLCSVATIHSKTNNLFLTCKSYINLPHLIYFQTFSLKYFLYSALFTQHWVSCQFMAGVTLGLWAKGVTNKENLKWDENYAWWLKTFRIVMGLFRTVLVRFERFTMENLRDLWTWSIFELENFSFFFKWVQILSEID